MSYPIENPNEIEDHTDEGIRQQVCRALRESKIPGEESIGVGVSNGVVVLYGDIGEESTHRIEELVKGIHHVKGLISKLQPMRL